MEPTQIARGLRIAKSAVQLAFYVLLAVAVVTSMLVRASGFDHFYAATGRTFVIQYGKGGEYPVYVWPWAGETFWTLAIMALTAGALFLVLRFIVRRIDKS